MELSETYKAKLASMLSYSDADMANHPEFAEVFFPVDDPYTQENSKLRLLCLMRLCKALGLTWTSQGLEATQTFPEKIYDVWFSPNVYWNYITAALKYFNGKRASAELYSIITEIEKSVPLANIPASQMQIWQQAANGDAKRIIV